MNKIQHQKFMTIQRRKIEVDKWCEGERQQSDPGKDYIMLWIFEHGQEFRDMYIKSKCKSCVFCKKCGHQVNDDCHECRQYE